MAPSSERTSLRTFLRRKPKPPKPEPLRTGIYTFQVVGSGWINKGEEHWPTAEVAEWERLGGRSRVSFLNISGVPRSYYRQVYDLVGEWVPTSSVVWRGE